MSALSEARLDVRVLPFTRKFQKGANRLKNSFTRLQIAIRHQHGCASNHVMTIPLTEQLNGRIVWQGEVEIFDLQGHATAKRCYAFAYAGADNQKRYAAVLELSPVDSPRGAVRSVLMVQVKRNENVA